MATIFGLKSKLIITIFLYLSLNSIVRSSCPDRESLVKKLPEFREIDLPCMYSGFISIDEETNSQIFYWLILATDHSESTPLTIWLNGGPGNSSLFGLFTEMGPLRQSRTGEFYVEKETTWTSKSNVLYIDQPVGTGYSFTNNFNSLPKSEFTVANHFYKFIQAFLRVHNDLLQNKMYLIGESYAGKYIPNIAKFILEENDKISKGTSQNIKLNLQKIAIGNGLFDAKYQRGARKDLAKGVNIMSEFDDESQYDMLVKNCEFAVSMNDTNSLGKCDEILDFLMDLAGDVYEYDIRKSRDNDDGLRKMLDSYLNREDVVSSLHVKNITIKHAPYYWELSNHTVKKAMKDDINLVSAIPVLESLLDNYDIPVVLYAGQFDLVDGPQGMERAINNMNYKDIKNWKNSPRELWKIKTNVDNDYVIAGYVKQFHNLVFITMRNAGHFAPRDRPYTSLNMIEHLFSDERIWKCPDDKCSLVEKKCKAMRYCSGNGSCDHSTGGKCQCKNGFYGPDCSIFPEILETNKVIKMSPRDTKMFNLSHYDGDILLEINSDDHNIIVSLLNKDDHEYAFNQKEHTITYKLINHKLVLFIEKEMLENFIVVITNLEFIHEIELTLYVNFYNFQKSFWGPGGFGFFLGISSLIIGIVLVVSAFYTYRKFRQEKAHSLHNSGETNYRAITNKV